MFLFFLCLPVYGQQFLNLDFEKISVEGKSRPWGWDFNDLYPYSEVFIDSTVSHNGKYSLLITGKKDTIQSILEQIEIFGIKGKQLKFSGWTKSENFFGNLSIHFDGLSNKDSSLKYLFSPTVKPDIDWNKFQFTISLPNDLKAFQMAFDVIGAGKIWIDDFKLMVDGKEMTCAPVGQGFTSTQIAWLSNNSTELISVDALKPEQEPIYKDLKLFEEIVADSKIIAIGESTHGTSEFFRLKNRLLGYVVKELNVRVFAIEDNQLIVERVNKYVLAGKGKARNSMYGMFSVWQNQEVLDLIKWIRNYNEKHPLDMVSFVGFDMQNPALPLDSSLAFLNGIDKPLFIKVDSLFMDLKNNWMNGWSASEETKKKWFQNAYTAFELATVRKQTWFSQAHSSLDSVKINYGLQYINLVKQFAENAMKGHVSLYRDSAMAENISWILRMNKPGTRILVWAHDNHISRGDHPIPERNYYNGISMGSYLSKWYGKAYKSFGQFTYEGNYWAQIGYSNYNHVFCPLFQGPKGSLDEALHRVCQLKKTNALILDLRNARSQEWLNIPTPVRFANHVCMEYSYWTRFSIPYQFDGLFFINTTSGARKPSNE